MSNFVYSIAPIFGVLTNKTFDGALVVGDEEEIKNKDLNLRAHIYSGDYFATLATTLDNISQNLDDKDSAEALRLQQLTDDLLYLQDRYKIISKDKVD